MEDLLTWVTLSVLVLPFDDLQQAFRKGVQCLRSATLHYLRAQEGSTLFPYTAETRAQARENIYNYACFVEKVLLQ
jgi:hypothetical protein